MNTLKKTFDGMRFTSIGDVPGRLERMRERAEARVDRRSRWVDRRRDLACVCFGLGLGLWALAAVCWIWGGGVVDTWVIASWGTGMFALFIVLAAGRD